MPSPPQPHPPQLVWPWPRRLHRQQPCEPPLPQRPLQPPGQPAALQPRPGRPSEQHPPRCVLRLRHGRWLQHRLCPSGWTPGLPARRQPGFWPRQQHAARWTRQPWRRRRCPPPGLQKHRRRQMPVSPQPQPASRPPQRHETRCWRLSERSPWLYFWRLPRKHEPQLLLHLSPCGPPLPPECQTLRQRRQPRQLQPLRRSGARLEQQQRRPATVRSQPTQHVVLQPSRASRPLPPGPRSPRREIPLGWPSSAPQQPCVRLAPRARPHTRVCQARGP